MTEKEAREPKAIEPLFLFSRSLMPFLCLGHESVLVQLYPGFCEKRHTIRHTAFGVSSSKENKIVYCRYDLPCPLPSYRILSAIVTPPHQNINRTLNISPPPPQNITPPRLKDSNLYHSMYPSNQHWLGQGDAWE